MLVKELFEAKAKRVPHGAHRFRETKEDIVAWLYEMGIKNHSYRNGPNGIVVDIDGNVNLNRKNLHYIPVQFGVVKGSFSCSGNPELETLKGAPTEVTGKFSCSDNPALTSLEYSPVKVGGLFNARQCPLTDLTGSPKYVGGNFNVYKCSLKSLNGAPDYVGGDFAIYHNRLTNLEGSPKIVNGGYSAQFNKLTSLAGITPEIGKDLYLGDNRLTSFKGINKLIKKMNGVINISGNYLIKECLVPLMLVNGLVRIDANTHKNGSTLDDPDMSKELITALRILIQFKSRNDVMRIQTEMIEAGLDDFAKN